MYIFCVSELIINSDPLKHLDLTSDVFRHGDYVYDSVAKTGDNSLLHSTVIKSLKVLHEQGFIPVSIMISDKACMLIVYQLLCQLPTIFLNIFKILDNYVNCNFAETLVTSCLKIAL